MLSALFCFVFVDRPINLLDEFEHRWSYSFAFGAISDTLLNILIGGQYLDLDLSPIGTGIVELHSHCNQTAI